ncbi:putative cell division protein FtsH2 [Ostreococcus tauri virus 2]|uniref:putative cell division protein FtsH2 n=1 Tax=Ostreococcus tauri virus 2 TaxID=696472 RepID=UPI0001EF47DD|nr:putative cell division protein FtsH2 [Ostreococcus tauri virus 2]CBI70008.1 putative cell division protein FtsH2 [Ostreococcus tauri virus 2]
MFSIGQRAAIPAPPLQIKRERAYHPRTYSEFVKGLKNGELPEVMIKPNQNLAVFEDNEGNYGDVQIIQNQDLWQTIAESDANVRIDMTSPASISDAISMVFLLSFIFFIFRTLMGGSGGAGPMNNPFLKNQEFNAEQEIETRFTDVEGIDAAKDELEEIVDFLKQPERYFGSGAKIPRGALLAGKPGTGKTLLARAIAGESNVPFIQCSAANFVEMFVGVGAKRVRDLFEIARENQPCIVFIDEIDAVGKQRSAGGMPANDEREQTINQLLTEMDGFDNETGIVVIAATNRVDILDDALLRPGRFDRKIQVALPSVRGREKILGVHARDKKLAEDVKLRSIAKQTTGFSGAELANLLNECAIRAVRDGNGVITNDIVENVYQRIVVGAKGDTKFSKQKKELVAYHEAGHAIIGAILPNYDTVRKVSIIPRGDAGGVTFFQPSDENAESAMYTKEYLTSQIIVALGGRAAEEIIYGKDRITTGASGDYAQVYMIAREMMTTYGFSNYNFDYRKMSEEATRLVDMEIDQLVDLCYKEALAILSVHKRQLEELKDKLIEEEIVDGEWVYEMFHSKPRHVRGDLDSIDHA